MFNQIVRSSFWVRRPAKTPYRLKHEISHFYLNRWFIPTWPIGKNCKRTGSNMTSNHKRSPDRWLSARMYHKWSPDRDRGLVRTADNSEENLERREIYNLGQEHITYNRLLPWKSSFHPLKQAFPLIIFIQSTKTSSTRMKLNSSKRSLDI